MVRFESLARFPILCIVTLALSYIITEIKRDIGRQLQFFSYPLHSTPPLRGRSIADFAVPFINIVYYCDLIVIVKPPLATVKAASCNGPVRLFVSLSVRLSVCLSPKYNNTIFSKTKQFRAMVSIDDLYEVVRGLFKEPTIGP